TIMRFRLSSVDSSAVLSIRRKVMSNHRPLSFRLISIIAIVCISVASALAQHDGTGSTAGGGSLGPSKPRTTTKPTTTKPTTSTRRTTPATTTPTTRRTAPRTTTTTPSTTPPSTPSTTPTTSTADFYEKQGDEQY